VAAPAQLAHYGATDEAGASSDKDRHCVVEFNGPALEKPALATRP
jgi:hypothetical protein